jgi:dihydrofolate reductase
MLERLMQCQAYKMRKVIFESSVSLDGFIEGPDGELDWLLCGNEPPDIKSFLSSFDTIFYGRKTYEKIGMPNAGDEIGSGIREQFLSALQAMRKYVFSRTRRHVQGNAMVVSENLELEVRRITEEDGKNIWLCGGADILKTFARLDLVDEYFLSVHPVVLAGGKPLFEGTKVPLNLNLVEEHKLRSGVVILRYIPASRINTISYGSRSI